MNDFNCRQFPGAGAALLATSSLAYAANGDDEPPYQGMTIKRNASVPLQDGGVLSADIFPPTGHGRYPVILSVRPYPKSIRFAKAKRSSTDKFAIDGMKRTSRRLALVGSDQHHAQAQCHRRVQRIGCAQRAGMGRAQHSGAFEIGALYLNYLKAALSQHAKQALRCLCGCGFIGLRTATLVGYRAGEFGQCPTADPKLSFTASTFACCGTYSFVEEQCHQDRGVEVGGHCQPNQ